MQVISFDISQYTQIIGSFHIRPQSAPRNAAPRLDGKTVLYRTNGTGRDTYIA